MSVSNRVGSNIEAAKSELEVTNELKLVDLKADHMGTINSLDTKYQLSHQTKLPRIMTNHALIPSNCHS